MNRDVFDRGMGRSVFRLVVAGVLVSLFLVGMVAASSSSGSSSSSSSSRAGSGDNTFSGGTSFFTGFELVLIDHPLTPSEIAILESLPAAEDIGRELLLERQNILNKESMEWYKQSVNNPSTGIYTVYVSMPSYEQYRADLRDLGGMLIQKYSKEDLWRQKALKRAAELFKVPGVKFLFEPSSGVVKDKYLYSKYATTPEEFVQFLEDPSYQLPWHKYSATELAL